MGYSHIDDTNCTKLDPKSLKFMFFNYGNNTKRYRVHGLEMTKDKVLMSVSPKESEVS